MTPQEVAEQCGRSREQRRQWYAYYQMWWSKGSDATAQNQQATFNKLRSHVDLLSAYLYAPETTRFAPYVSPDKLEEWRDHLDVAGEEFARDWQDSGADVVFAMAVEWACINGFSGLKVVTTEDEVGLTYIYPGDIGVLREDIRSFDRQNGITHWSYITLPEFDRLVQPLDNRKVLMDLARQRAHPEYQAGSSQYPKFLNQVIVSTVQGGNVQGIVPLGALGDALPEVQEPIVEIAEVWEQDAYRATEGRREGQWEMDWRVTTLLDREVIVPPRRNPTLGAIPEFNVPAESPFIGLVPKPRPDYFWGISELVDLINLQVLREDRLWKINQMLDRQLKPPTMASGFPNADEFYKAFMTSDSRVATSMTPGAKVEQFAPKFPENVPWYFDQLDMMFSESGGMDPILTGVNPPGARAGQQIGALATLAAGGRIRKKALYVEDALKTAATKYFHALQRIDATEYPLRSGKGKFLLSQIPPSVKMLVAAHSASPVFAEQLAEKATAMLAAKAIGLADYVEMMNPPQVEILKAKARIREEQQAEIGKEMLQIQKAKYLRNGKAR